MAKWRLETNPDIVNELSIVTDTGAIVYEVCEDAYATAMPGWCYETLRKTVGKVLDSVVEAHNKEIDD